MGLGLSGWDLAMSRLSRQDVGLMCGRFRPDLLTLNVMAAACDKVWCHFRCPWRLQREAGEWQQAAVLVHMSCFHLQVAARRCYVAPLRQGRHRAQRGGAGRRARALLAARRGRRGQRRPGRGRLAGRRPAPNSGEAVPLGAASRRGAAWRPMARRRAAGRAALELGGWELS